MGPYEGRGLALCRAARVADWSVHAVSPNRENQLSVIMHACKHVGERSMQDYCENVRKLMKLNERMKNEKP